MYITLFTGLIIMVGFFGLGYFHEQVHVQTFKYYGVESHVEYFSHFPDFITIPDDPCPDSSCILAHSINESIGYPLMILYPVFGLVMLFIVGLLEMIVNKKKEENMGEEEFLDEEEKEKEKEE